MAKDDFEAIIGELLSPETAQMSHSSVEKLLSERGQELMRKLFQAHLDARGLERRRLRCGGRTGSIARTSVCTTAACRRCSARCG